MKLSNEMYDYLKYWMQIVLPAICTFVFAVGNIWNIHILTDYSEQIVGTLAALDALLGVLLKISSNNYYAGKHEGE